MFITCPSCLMSLHVSFSLPLFYHRLYFCLSVLFCLHVFVYCASPSPCPSPPPPLCFPSLPLSLLPLLFPLPLLSPLLSPSLAPPSSCKFSPSLIAFLIGIIVIVHIAIAIDNQSNSLLCSTIFLSLSVTKGSFCGDCGQPCIVS